jgi:MFS family permease
VQVNVDEHYRGRVLSVYVMSFFAGTPIGALIGGIAASFIGLRATIVVSATILAIAVIVTMLRYPWFRVLDETRMGFDGHLERSGADLDTAAHLIVEPLE